MKLRAFGIVIVEGSGWGSGGSGTDGTFSILRIGKYQKTSCLSPVCPSNFHDKQIIPLSQLTGALE